MAIKSIFLAALALAAVSAERQYSWDQIGEVSDRIYMCLGELGNLPDSSVHVHLTDVCANNGTEELFANKTLDAVTPAVIACMRSYPKQISEAAVVEAEQCLNSALGKSLSVDSESNDSNGKDSIDDVDQIFEIREYIRDCLDELPADPNYSVHIKIGDECSNSVMFHLRSGGSKKEVVSIVLSCMRNFPKITPEQASDAQFCVSGVMEEM